MAWQLNNTIGLGMEHSTGDVGSRLQLRDIEHITASTTIVEAEELIRHWLAGVESATSTSHGGDREGAIRSGAALGENTSLENEDFLSTLDWISGDIGQSTKDVLKGLLSKELKCEASHHPTAKKRSHDPRITMEMRHREVRQRHKDREKKRCEEMERKGQREAAQREARALMLEEERRAKIRASEEERLIQKQMKALRKEVRERERLAKELALEQSLIAKEEPSTLTGEEGARSVVEAERFIESERRRVSTRMELVRQLEEVEVKETKENMKLLHQCFQNWWGQVMKERGKLAKATAVKDWKLLLRVWKSWRWFVRERREKRARHEIATRLQREKRLIDIAVGHHVSRILQRSLGAWHKLTRLTKIEKRQEEERLTQRAKMAALLQAATAKAQRQRNTEELSVLSDVTPSKENVAAPQHRLLTNSQQPLTSHQARVGKATLTQKENTTKVRSNVNHEEEGLRRCQHGVQQISRPLWKKARVQLDDLLSEIEAPLMPTPTSPPISCLEVANRESDLSKVAKSRAAPQTHQPKPKAVTKQLNMTVAMERRSAEIAERRLAREKRKEAKMKERAEQLAREEDERRKAEAALKEAKLKQRREERQLAKQRELERLERQKVLEEKITRASTHFQTAQLRWRGVAPWKKFVEDMKSRCLEAEQLRERTLTRVVWSRWRRITVEREREREAIATAHYQRALLKKSLTAWIKFLELGIELEALAEYHRPRLLLKRVFRGWADLMREERREEWEKMARARRFRQRQVQRCVLRAWHDYVPAAREEREREKRRDQMRLKVASWLTDYQLNAKHTNA